MTNARCTPYLTIGAISAFALSLAACGGGGSGVTPAAPNAGAGSTTVQPTSSPAAVVPGGTSGTLSFAITVPAATKTTAGKTVQYVSPSTQSVAITLSGQTTPLATVNLSATATGCAPATGGATACTVTATAPAGDDTFIITAFDGQNGTGHELSTARVPATITASATTRVPLTLNGTVATVSVILGSTSLQVGTPAAVSVTIVAYDASSNIIVGPGTFSTPVTLTDTDLSGATSLSTTTVTAPGTSVTLNYNGNSMTSAVITPAIGSTTGTPATFRPTGSAVASYIMPAPIDQVVALAPGPNGMWFSSSSYYSTASLGYVTPAGVATVFTTNVTATNKMGLAQGADGNMWFGDDNGLIGKITATGAVTMASSYAPCNGGACGMINSMTLGPDGNVWFADDDGEIGSVTPAGAVNEVSISALPGFVSGSTEPKQLAFYGGKLYASDEYSYIDQFTIAGGAVVSVVQVSYPQTNGCSPGGYALTIDPATGNIWFSDGSSNIGMIPTSNFTATGILEWSIDPVIGSVSIPYMQATASGIFATDNSDGNVYQITNAGSVSATQSPNFTSLAAYQNGQAETNVLALGRDGNLWTVNENTTDRNPVVPPVFTKLITSLPLNIATASTRLASAARKHVKSGKMFPASRMDRKLRKAYFAARRNGNAQ